MPVKLTQQSNTNAQLPYEPYGGGTSGSHPADRNHRYFRSGAGRKGPGTGKISQGRTFGPARCKRGGIDTDPWDRHSESSEIKMHR